MYFCQREESDRKKKKKLAANKYAIYHYFNLFSFHRRNTWPTHGVKYVRLLFFCLYVFQSLLLSPWFRYNKKSSWLVNSYKFYSTGISIRKMYSTYTLYLHYSIFVPTNPKYHVRKICTNI